MMSLKNYNRRLYVVKRTASSIIKPFFCNVSSITYIDFFFINANSEVLIFRTNRKISQKTWNDISCMQQIKLISNKCSMIL